LLSAPRHPISPLFPYTTLFRSACQRAISNQSQTIRVPSHVHERRLKLARAGRRFEAEHGREATSEELSDATGLELQHESGCVGQDRKSTRLNSSHVAISYAVFC